MDGNASYVERYRISIQVSNLGGYSFKVSDNKGKVVEEESNASGEDIFARNLLSHQYSEYDFVYRTHKFTLVPEGIDYGDPREALAEIVDLDARDSVFICDTAFKGVRMIYALSSDDPLLKATDAMSKGIQPAVETLRLLEFAASLTDHNKVVASYGDSLLSLVVCEGDNLLLCNSYPAPDFTTALYYVFTALNQFQINPEVTLLHYRGYLDEDRQMLVYKYFSGVEEF